MPRLPAGEGDLGTAFASHSSSPETGAPWGEIKRAVVKYATTLADVTAFKKKTKKTQHLITK